MNKRQEGFYWIKINNIWTIAEYSDSRWWIPGREEPILNDSDIYEIDEQIIEKIS